LGLPIGCKKFLFPKEFVTIFGLGYLPFAMNTLPKLLKPLALGFYPTQITMKIQERKHMKALRVPIMGVFFLFTSRQ
jgi:hypothetical protein